MPANSGRLQKRLVSVTIENPLDPLYPFGRDLYEDVRVVYHGTWSTHCSAIEACGMGKGCLAYEQRDIDALCEIREQFGFLDYAARSGGLSVLSACAYGIEAGKRLIYFTRNYWHARNHYARNPGGETVRHAVKVIADLERLTTDSSFRQSHAHCLRKLIRESRGEEREVVRRQLTNLGDARLLKEAGRKVAVIARRLRPLAEGGHPVIYAVKADPRWWDSWESDQHRVGTLAVPRVPVSRIRGRADFVNES